uniref:Uncharacterized protein n=1 Tax=Anguilla anguilla TaxID=7936 RepID=A0A0E9R2S3_ANGAN
MYHRYLETLHLTDLCMLHILY